MEYEYRPFTRELEIEYLISLFSSKLPPDFSVFGEAHDFWELVFVDHGQVVISAGEKEYILKKGELAFHKPGEFHAVRTYGGVGAGIIISAFVCKAPAMKYFEHRLTSLCSYEKRYLYEALRFGKTHADDILLPGGGDVREHGSGYGAGQLTQQNLEALLIFLIRRGASETIQKRVESYSQRMQAEKLTGEIREFLGRNLSRNLTINDVARHFSYSGTQIKLMFRKCSGCGIIDYFIDLKMREAKNLLWKSQMNVSEIGKSLGYGDSSYFSRVFKSRTGVSPLEYRQSALM